MSAPEDSNTFKILKDYFRNQLIKHFESIQHTKCLIVESSLLGVVQHLFTQPPETCRVQNYGALFDHKVSQNLQIESFRKCRLAQLKVSFIS